MLNLVGMFLKTRNVYFKSRFWRMTRQKDQAVQIPVWCLIFNLASLVRDRLFWCFGGCQTARLVHGQFIISGVMTLSPKC